MIVGTDRSRTEGAPDSFCFACQKERPCFTTCCANLKLVLTPYDILRLKTRLQLTTGRPTNVLKKLGNRQLQMYYMACYNLDEFRRYILESSFRQRFDLAQATWQRLAVDDVDLLTFAAHWLEFALFGVPLKTANGFTPR